MYSRVITFTSWQLLLGKDTTPPGPPAMTWIVTLLFYYKNVFGIKWATKFYKALKSKETESIKPMYSNILETFSFGENSSSTEQKKTPPQKKLHSWKTLALNSFNFHGRYILSIKMSLKVIATNPFICHLLHGKV